MTNYNLKIKTNSVLKVLLMICGLLLTTIGMIGIVVPGLPTTVFMILAAACFFRSSERLYLWIIQNKLFGQHVKNYRLGLGMPKRVKKVAYAFMWLFILLSIGFILSNDLIIIKISIFIAGLIGTFFIKRLPTLD
jgi:uncharacterized protein